MAIPRELAAVPPDRLAQAVGLNGFAGVCPWSTQCPVCGTGRLLLYQDKEVTSVWCHCETCRTAGTLIDLAAVTWAVSYAEALTKVSVKLGVQPPSVAEVAACRAERDRQRAVTRLWEKACTYPYFKDDLADYYDAFTVAVGKDPLRWSYRGGQFVGATDRESIEAVTGPLTSPGGDWKDAWLLPVYSAPGRISGFSVIAGETVTGVSTVDAEPPVGLVCPGALNEKRTIVVISCDPVLATRMQVLHLADPSETGVAGVVGLFPASAAAGWPSGLDTHPLVVWAVSLTADVLRHARAFGARVAIATEPADKAVAVALTQAQKFGVVRWTEKVRKASIPWTDAMADLLVASAKGDAVEIAKAVSPTEAEWEAVAAAAGRHQRRVNEVRTAAEAAEPVVIDGKAVRETADGWLANNELITNAPPVVTHVQTVDGQLVYAGYVTYQGRTYPFDAPAKAFTADAFSWLTQHLIKAGVSPLPFFNPSWRKRAAAVAIRLHPPKVKT